MDRSQSKISDVFDKYKGIIAGSLIWGGIAHFYVLTNIIQNHDNVATQPKGYGTGVTSGRWFLTVLGDVVTDLGGNYNLSWFNGVAAILLLTIALCLIADIFHLEGKYGFLFAGIFISYPALSSTFFFMFTVVYYALAILMSVLAVYFTEKCRYGFGLAIVLEACSLGIYQAYFPITAALFVILLIVKSLTEGVKPIIIIRRGLFYFLILLGGVALYFICVRISLQVYDVNLNTHAGIDHMGKLSFSEIPSILKLCYLNYYKLCIQEYHSVNYNAILKISCLISELGAILLLSSIWRERHIKPSNILISAGLTILVFPLAVNGIEIMCYNGGRMYELMVYATSLIFLLPLVLLKIVNTQKCNKTKKERVTKRLYNGVLTITMVLTVLSYTYLANIKYTAMYYMNQQTTNYYNELVTRIKSSDGYKADYKLIFVGDIITDASFVNPWGAVSNKVKAYDSLINTYSRNSYIKNYLGYSFQTIDGDKKKEWLSDHDLTQMSCYPDWGSIQVIDDIVVIKFSNN